MADNAPLCIQICIHFLENTRGKSAYGENVVEVYDG